MENRFRYEQISDHIIEAVERGNLSPGCRLPSLRKMSERWDCALSVVMQAYGDLEMKGIIRSVEKSGYFVESPRNAPLAEQQTEAYHLKPEESRPLSIIGKVVEASNDSSVIPLGAGIPHHSLLPVNALRQSLGRAAREEPLLIQKYTDEAGYLPLRREIGQLLFTRGINAGPEDLIITNGCTEALSLALSVLTVPGEPVAVESPQFLGQVQILGELKRRVIPVPTSPSEGMDLDRLEVLLKKGLVKTVIMTAVHQNPLGFVMPPENRKRAVSLAGKYDAHIIEDDMYSECSHDHEIRRPLKSYDRSGRVLYCSSFSKTISPGFRIGWLMGGSFGKACANLKMTQTLGGSLLLQAAMADYLGRGTYGSHLKRLQKSIFLQSCQLKSLILESFPSGTTISSPGGGYYFWIRLPGNKGGLELFRDALDHRIGIVPGEAFSTGGRYGDCIRVSFGSPVTEETRRAVALLGRLAQG